MAISRRVFLISKPSSITEHSIVEQKPFFATIVTEAKKYER